MDEHFDARAMMVTTIHIPIWLRNEIKMKGYTLPGALMSGWQILQRREDIDQLLADRNEMQKNVVLYQKAYVDAINRIAILEAKK